jgi:hypothetical protein
VNRDELAQRWPQFALGIGVGDTHLQAPTDTELAVLARRAAEPMAILPTAASHFVKWVQGRTPEEIERQRIARVRSNCELTKAPRLDARPGGDGLGRTGGNAESVGIRAVATPSHLQSPVRRQHAPVITGAAPLVELLDR